eukprot:CAMPEP_0116139288 /NCGR_PEP_ID=MMETSP0329-20121206/13235_1 /TAXON_ID=697910 /ORGANISM="Pseudo-nitzschia arenysensis, Strain B593" /LENGTH=293 /DNA_ID=CAMNT_0003634327 /DNA_START=30 /DNA_END=911 /DNA_ORIENTATION=-
MAEIEAQGLPLHPAVGAEGVDRQNVVSHGETSESDNEDMFADTDEEVEDNASTRKRRNRSAGRNLNDDTDGESNAGADKNDNNNNNNNNNSNNDAGLLFYDENLDEEDEAYVYKHMRGGITENVTVSTRQSGSSGSNGGKSGNPDGGVTSDSAHESSDDRRQQVVQMLKPRHSDAVLSCPCCFNIVCMDCQKHKRYANQYRAMFVMGVVVDWRHILVYDEAHRGLVTKEQTIIEEGENEAWDSAEGESYGMIPTKDGEYYAVECTACRTQVAALDMKDEVYYFHGCLESSSAF